MEVLFFALFFIGFLISLFTLFALSKNDFVLLRRGVTVPHVFDTAFIGVFAGLFVARVFFIFDTFLFSYFNPIQFVHIFLYPGFSLFGFYLGFFGVVLYFYLQKKAFARAIDLYTVSFFFIFLSYLVYGVLVYANDIIRIAHLFLSILFLFLSVYFYRHFTLKDGGIGILVLMFVSGSYVVSSFEMSRALLLPFLSITQILSVGVFLFSLVFFVLHQFIFKK